MSVLKLKSNIALLTDFGIKGQHYVASMKAVILNINPNVNIIDISHNISPYSIIEASYLLKSTFNHFPKGTIFIVVVDPGVGSEREIIIIKTNSNYYFIAPNNGILANVLDETEISECYLIQNEKYFNKPISNTFHGRDIMAPIGSHISNGILLKEFGPNFNISKLIEFPLKLEIFLEERKIICQIQFIDSFGNGTTNIIIKNNKIRNFDIILANESILKFEIKNKTYEGTFTTHFSNVLVNSILFLVGSSGFLEVSINKGNASEELNFKVGDIITIMF